MGRYRHFSGLVRGTVARLHALAARLRKAPTPQIVPTGGRRSPTPVETLLLSHLDMLAESSLVAFSGEDPINGNPWYHQDLTAKASKSKGFDPVVADTLAWHADYVDSYLYNPLWWVQGGIGRLRVSVATGGELEKLHFDDLFNVNAVRAIWQRLFYGTLAGLVWAAERNDVSAAHNILGTSLHAVQDFYSHSSWVDDPARRTHTWFEVEPSSRHALPIWTGSYGRPPQLGIKPHGKIAPLASLFKQPGVEPLMEIACSAFSPLANSGLCQQWRLVKEGQPAQPQAVAGVPLPPNVIYFAPPGIAIDNSWTAKIAVQVRGITDVNSDQLLQIALTLAQRASEQWLTMLGDALSRNGLAAFWESVHHPAPGAVKEYEYEHYDRFPYMFLTAGPYPVDNLPGDEYYLRVRMQTAPDFGAGTDAPIYLHAAGVEFPCDYKPDIAYNDFEAGDNTAYMVGPFPSMPTEITLENRAASGLTVVQAAGRAIVEILTNIGEAVRQALLSIVGGNADLVGQQKQVWGPTDLAAITGTAEAVLYVDGGDEGKYNVYASITRTGETADGQVEYEVRLNRFYCIKESKVDGASSDDEPFIMAALTALPGNIQSYCSSPFNGVDSNEWRDINQCFARVRVPKGYGMIVLSICIMESDLESAADRAQLCNNFVGGIDRNTAQARNDFVEKVGAAIASDWRLAHLEVTGFSRMLKTGAGYGLRTGTVLNAPVNCWINGGQRATFSLNLAAMREVTFDLEQTYFAPAPPVEPAPAKRRPPQRDRRPQM